MKHWNAETLKRFLLVAFIFFVTPVHANSSINVPLDDPVYDLIAKLAASGLIEMPNYGQRPWTREYVGKMVAEALGNKQKLEDALDGAGTAEEYSTLLGHKRFINFILKKLSADYKSETLKHSNPETLKRCNIETLKRRNTETPTKFHPLSSISMRYTYLNNAPSPVPPANNYGNIDAFIQPLAANREGRKYIEGQNYYIETEHSAQVTPYFSFYARPQFEFLYPENGDEETHVYLHNLYAKTGWKDIELEFGRDQMLWGQGISGGLLFSGNPRGLDMIKIASPYPLALFWPVRFTALAANLGPEYNPKETWIVGGRVDLSPLDWWNFGFNYVSELHDNHAANQKLSFDTRVVVKKMRGWTLYGEGLIDDNDAAHMAWQAGLDLPRLDYIGKWSLGVEYQQINKYVYRNTDYPSGWALNKFLIGNSTGPESNMVTTRIDYHFTPESKVEISGGYIFRGSPTNEHHAINEYLFMAPLKKNRLYLTAEFGFDYVVNKDFAAGNNKADFLGEIGLTLKFPEF